MDVRMNRIILFGRDVTALKIFYQSHFNFALIEETPQEWVVLKAGSVEIAFHKVGAVYDTTLNDPFKAESNIKLVFQLDGDLTAFRKSLINKGVLLKTIKSFSGCNDLFCDGEDPEGNIFQLVGKDGAKNASFDSP